MWFHGCTRLKVSGNSPPTAKRKDFLLIGTDTGVFLWGATSKRDSMWHSPVFTCIRANRIPVEIYNKMGVNYAFIWKQFCVKRPFPCNQDSVMNKVCVTFKCRSSSKILFATAIVFFRGKYGHLVKCWGLLDSSWQGPVLRKRLVKLVHLRRFKSHIPVQAFSKSTRTIHYAASLELKSWFSIWERKLDCVVLPKLTGMIQPHL